MPVPLRFRLTHPARCRAPAACWHRHPAQDTAPPARSFDSWRLSCSGAEFAAPVQSIDVDAKWVLAHPYRIARRLQDHGHNRGPALHRACRALDRGALDPAHLKRSRRCPHHRSEEHTSELQSLMRISYAVFCLKKKNNTTQLTTNTTQ